MPKRVFTEAQKEANRKGTKLWRVAAKEKGPEYEGEVEESDIMSPGVCVWEIGRVCQACAFFSATHLLY